MPRDGQCAGEVVTRHERGRQEREGVTIVLGTEPERLAGQPLGARHVGEVARPPRSLQIEARQSRPVTRAQTVFCGAF